MKTKHLFFLPILFCLIPLVAFGDEIKITDVYRLGYDSKSPPNDKISVGKYNEERRTAGINDTLVVEVNDLKALTAEALCLQQPPKPTCKSQNIDLYLNGKKIAERDPNDGSLGRTANTIEFDLKYDVDKIDLKNNWASLLSVTENGFFQRPVKLAVGLDDANSNLMLELKENDKPPFQLRRIDMAKFWICIGLLIAFIIIGFRSHEIKKTIREALSDIGPPPATGLKQWSLARCQMAFWFILVVVSFLSIWVVTGALNTVNDSVLALIGIGSGAALGSAMIDVSTDTQSKLDELRKKSEAIISEILEVDSKITTVVEGSTQAVFLTSLKSVTEDRLKTVNEQIIRRSKIAMSKGFWNDILNDQEGGAGFHRIQMVVWTLILGSIFVYSVWDTLSMPVFDATMLALQGISAGTYLGFKIPDKT
jgi:hypothetical protein